MDSAAARGICRRGGVGEVKSLEVRTLWLQQVIKVKTLTLKTVKSHDNCADFGTKTLTAGTLTQLISMNSLVDKKAMDDGCRAICGMMTSTGESDGYKTLVLKVLEQALNDIARDGHKTSGGEKLLRGLGRNLGRNLERNLERTFGSEQLVYYVYELVTGFGVIPMIMKSRGMHTPLPRLLLSICRVGDCCDLLEPVHAGGVHEICENPDSILSSLLMFTRLDLLGSSCCLLRIAHRSSCVHRRPLLCQSAVRSHSIVVLARASQCHLQPTIVAILHH